MLFSERSRKAYASAAAASGATYTFTDAWGNPRTWLKGDHAYLAPNAAGLLLAHCNLKHDLIEEEALDGPVLDHLKLLLVPNAAHLAGATIARIERWLGVSAERCLLVTGRTNLPAGLLGLARLETLPVTGDTGWRWRADSPFAGPDWQPHYVSGYAGHVAQRAEPGPGARVLADLPEFDGDLTEAHTATATPLGPAIVTTGRTAHAANQVFELIGGMMQAHLNTEAVRHWSIATHWGDALRSATRRPR